MSKLSDKIIVKVNGEDREIFMSFGLLNELTKIVEDPARVTAISVDNDLRDMVLKSLLATRKVSGKVENPCDLDDTEISVEDVERLLAWGAEHTLGFFLRSLQKVMELTKKNEKEMTALASFASGSQGSTSETPSAGPSNEVPAN